MHAFRLQDDSPLLRDPNCVHAGATIRFKCDLWIHPEPKSSILQLVRAQDAWTTPHPLWFVGGFNRGYHPALMDEFFEGVVSPLTMYRYDIGMVRMRQNLVRHKPSSQLFFGHDECCAPRAGDSVRTSRDETARIVAPMRR